MKKYLFGLISGVFLCATMSFNGLSYKTMIVTKIGCNGDKFYDCQTDTFKINTIRYGSICEYNFKNKFNHTVKVTLK